MRTEKEKREDVKLKNFYNWIANENCVQNDL